VALLQSILERATTGRRGTLVAAALLAVVTVAVYLPVTQATFLNYDDDTYIINNVYVTRWRGWENIAWAFTSIEATHWHPLTWFSHMIDAQLFGARPSLHHLSALTLHIANSVLLLLALKRLTGLLWPSAMVAALFALHPVSVESTAWISERKNLLSTFFFMLTLMAYAPYARQPGIKRYVLVFFLLTLGLMAKSMLVTVPFVLLLLDGWPLGRMNAEGGVRNAESAGDGGELAGRSIRNPQSPFRNRIGRLFLEKLPLLSLSVAASIVATLGMKQAHMIPGTDELSIQVRAANVALSYVGYIGKMLWPSDLVVFYPYRHEPPVGDTVCSILILVAITAAVVWQIRRRPYLAVGWFWFLGMLVPVIGILQVGEQAMADHFDYVPQIGLFIMIAWGARDLVQARSRSRKGQSRLDRAILPAAGLAALAVCAGLSARQVTFWHDTETLLRHNVEAFPDNAILHEYLGEELDHNRHPQEAMAEYQEAIRLDPNYFLTYASMGVLLYNKGDLQQAADHCLRAIELKPDREEAYNTLGLVYTKEATLLNDPVARKGRLNQAMLYFQKAIKLSPGWGDPYANMSLALDLLGRTDEAIAANLYAMELKPFWTMPHVYLGRIYLRQGRLAEAAAEMQTAVRLNPFDAQAHLGLGQVLMQQQGLGPAAQEFKRALALDPNLEEARANLVRLRGGTR
jgi:protein O-mannosyl-transferase